MTTHIMLDLETWGKRPGCDIRSIGACVFDPATGRVYARGAGDERWPDFYIACDNPMVVFHKDVPRYNLHRDPDTVKWWSEQSTEAQAAFADPVDLRKALGRFTQWLMTVAPACGPSIAHDIALYAHGPQFDVSILAEAYEAVGLPVPWHYRAPRDTRTVFDLAGIEDHSSFMAMFPHGTAHNALDDAIAQATAICAAVRIIRTGERLASQPAPGTYRTLIDTWAREWAETAMDVSPLALWGNRIAWSTARDIADRLDGKEPA